MPFAQSAQGLVRHSAPAAEGADADVDAKGIHDDSATLTWT